MPNPYTGTLNDPISEAQHGYLGKDWEKFFKLIGGGKVYASAQGPGAPVSLAGAGRTDRGRGSVALPSEGQRIGDEDIFRTNQVNAYLGELTDENKLRAQAERDMAAHNQAVDAQSAGRQAAERGLAIANDPRTSQFGAPILNTGEETYQTGTGVPAVNRQAIAAQMAPGQIATPASAPPVTFGKPTPQKVGGQTILTREGSDGLTYDMAHRLIAPDTIEAPPDKAATVKPATPAERGILAYHNRAKQAEDTISGLESTIRDKGLIGGSVLKWAPNILQPEENQTYRQAQRAFTEARLRKESGAAIPPEEFASDERTYFAQPGDSAAVLEKKRKGREKVLEGLAFSSGKAYDEFYGEPFKKADGGGGDGGGGDEFAVPKEGAKRGIPGVEGGLAEMRGGKWIRVQ